MTDRVAEGIEPRAKLSPSTAVIMLAVMGATYAVNAMDRGVFAVLLPNVNREFSFSLEQGGFLATIFTLGLGLSGIPTGFLLDRLSRMTVIMIGIAIFSILTILSAFSSGFTDMAIYRAFSGLGEGMQNAALFTAVGAYFAANRAAVLGSMNFAYGIGSFIGPSLAATILVSTNQWRAPLIVYGVLGLVIMVIARLVVPPDFTEKRSEGLAAGHDARVPSHLLNRNVLICAFCAVMLGIAGYGFLGLYPTFLRAELGFTAPQAGFAASLYGLGALFGIPAGYVADRASQRLIAVIAAIAMAASCYLMFNAATAVWAQDSLAVLFGAVFSGASFVNIYSLMQRCVQPSLVGRASGVMVTCFYLPASVSGYLFAVLRNHFGWGNAASLQLCLVPSMIILAMTLFDKDAVRRPQPVA